MHNVQSIIRKFLIEYYKHGSYDNENNHIGSIGLEDMATKRSVEIGKLICDYCEGTRIDIFNREKECPFCLEKKSKIEESRKGVGVC